MKRKWLLIPAILLLIAHSAQGWQNQRSAARSRRGTISGRVLADGQPMPYASVIASKHGDQRHWRNVITDKDGTYEFNDLEPGLYQMSVAVPAYIDDSPDGWRRGVRVGDRVDFTLTRGGVITGRVTDAAGEPLPSVTVRAMRVRDVDGNPSSGSYSRRTDDRGIYRFYGLVPGRYIVSVGGGASALQSPDPFIRDAPTYHPSSTRATAQEVTVQAGAEVSGIDIRHRGEAGHSISGRLKGVGPGASMIGQLYVLLYNAWGGTESYYYPPDSSSYGFEFSGVADGVYYVQAQQFGNSQEDSSDDALSPLQRVEVKGGDVTDLTLVLMPTAAVNGRLTREPALEADLPEACKGAGAARTEDFLIRIYRDQPDSPLSPLGVEGRAAGTAANEQGNFTLARLEAGLYRLTVTPSDERWYVRAITLAQGANRNVDAALSGLSLKSGQRLSGLTVSVAPGAAFVSGNVIARSQDEGLPAGLRVYLIPADPAMRDQFLRYYEARVHAGGVFTLKSVAPGRYFVLAQEAGEELMRPGFAVPALWDTGRRRRLAQRAAALKQIVELPPCGRIEGLPVVFTPQPEAPRRPRR